jgi:gamma-glutamylcyclotransferase (GGCT)/AIG2-like uncharacterized protein YtfP
MAQLLFSYGTLRQPNVQLELFGSELITRPATLPMFDLEMIEITDEKVIATSGSNRHPILVFTGVPNDFVLGSVLELTDEQLAAADAYEVADYARQEVTLETGEKAWAYLPAVRLAK